MGAAAILISVLLSSMVGAGAGFCTGLVPGLHVNNLAAVVVASSASFVGLFCSLGLLSGCDEAALLVACFLVAAMVAHMFSESIVATYLGIPSGDNVSLLPAHRLAKEGLGRSAVLSSADGSLAGAVAGLLFMIPICALLGPPVDAYSSIKAVMGLVVGALSVVLVASEGFGRPAAVKRVTFAAAFFLLAGLVGYVVLDTNYFASSMPDFPWIHSSYVPRSSLLLPLFAGLFGIPTLLLSLGSCSAGEEPSDRIAIKDSDLRPVIRAKDVMMSSLGGVLVGWIPGVTSGSSATLCANAMKGAAPEGGQREEAVRFIWLYSAISSCGAVLSVGALFLIARARSGIMQAVVFFMDDSSLEIRGMGTIGPMCAILLSMLAAALWSHAIIHHISGALLMRLQGVLCSRRTAIVSMAFVVSLVLCLTGTRGGLLLVVATTLGLMPPLCGLRRINLMGCLLLPICVTFLSY
jgi:putative membrane protein